MLKENYTSMAAEFVVYPPTFIDCVPIVKIPLKHKIRKTIERIVKIDLSLKKDFLKLGRKKKHTHANLYEKKEKAEFTVIAYPESDIKEVLHIMNSLKLTTIPIAKNPWNKKLVGFMEKDSIEKELKDETIS